MACDVHFGIGQGGKNYVQRTGGGVARYVAAGTEVDRAMAAETMFA